MLYIQPEEEGKAQANQQRQHCASHNPKTSTEQLHPELSLQRDAMMKHITQRSSMPTFLPQFVRMFCKGFQAIAKDGSSLAISYKQSAAYIQTKRKLGNAAAQVIIAEESPRQLKFLCSSVFPRR